MKLKPDADNSVKPSHLQRAARKLIWSPLCGREFVQDVVSLGDQVIPYLDQESEGFTRFGHKGSFFVAEVLGELSTLRSREILFEIYYSENEKSRLVGILGLAHQGVTPDHLDYQKEVIDVILIDHSRMKTSLAIEIIGVANFQPGLPLLLNLLKDGNRRDLSYERVCMAIARLRNSDGIHALEACLTSPGFPSIPSVFRALLVLEGNLAIGLAIKQIDPQYKGYGRGHIVDELEEVTGQSFGFSRANWERWWKAESVTWLTEPKHLAWPD